MRLETETEKIRGAAIILEQLRRSDRDHLFGARPCHGIRHLGSDQKRGKIGREARTLHSLEQTERAHAEEKMGESARSFIAGLLQAVLESLAIGVSLLHELRQGPGGGQRVIELARHVGAEGGELA